MSDTHRSHEDQEALWNGPAGRAWVEASDVLDRMFQPFEDRLTGEVAASHRVLDVGCGTGSTTLAIARKLLPTGRSVGIDLSAPQLAVAQARARQEGIAADFILGDAQTCAFASADFDLIVSRFGVMFFDDPVRAFSHLRRAAKDGAGLRFIAWRSGSENPFMTTAERAAAPLLPELPARRSGGPGQFAFEDRGRVQGILEAGGWAGIDIQPIDVICRFPERDLMRYLTWLGPVGAVLQQTAEPLRGQVIEAVRAAFDRYVYGDEVRFTAACWWVSAQAS